MIDRTKRLGLALGILFSCNILAQALVGFVGMEPTGSLVPPGSTLFNDKNDTGSPVASDTKITKTWNAIETIESWWDDNWQYRKKAQFSEPGLMDRMNDPVDLYVSFTGNQSRENSIRLTYFRDDTSAWVEVPSQIWNVTRHQNATGAWFYDSCTVMFFLNITKGDTEIYYIYYDSYIGTAPTYTDQISATGGLDAAITNDNGANGIMPTVYGPTQTWTNRDSIYVYDSRSGTTPISKVALVDTMRAASDWGGCVNSPYSMYYGSTDTLSIAQRTWFSFGDMSLQATYDPNYAFDGGYQRINVGPDSADEAWDGQGRVTILEDGPLFVRFRITTTDGAYASVAALTDTTYWYRNNFNGLCATDTVVRDGNDGGVGYVKYNLTYTYYYFNPSTLAKLELNITALPQRGDSDTPIIPAYPYTRANYINTGVNFKNYGDWPHIGQLVRGNTGTVAQNNKAWIGSKYGLYSTPITERRRDYPLEPWTAWYNNITSTVPTVGMFARTNSIGWEVTSLAVTGIGPNSLLQQILPEGHQGDQYTMPRFSTFSYDYYMMSDSFNNNYTGVRDMARRMNDPVSQSVGNAELFANNGLFIHTNDHDGNTATGIRVLLSYASNGTVVYNEYVNSIGNVSYLLLPDNTYRVQCVMNTENLLTQYVVASETLVLDHKIQRSTYRIYNCNMANLTFDVVNWARNNEKLTGAMLKFKNITSGLVVEQNITWGGYATFRLYTNGATQYNIVTEYGGTTRVSNITSPYTLTGNSLLRVGMQIETTAINIVARDASTVLGHNYNMTFEFYSSGNLTKKIGVESVSVSSDYDANYWTLNVDYFWVKTNYYTVALNLSTGFTKRLNSSGILALYIHSSNTTVETATEKIFVVINPIVTTMVYTLNDTVTNQVSVVRGGVVHLEIDYQYGLPKTDITDATVTYTINSVPTIIPYNGGNGNYSAIILTSGLDKGTYIITLKATRMNYEDQLDSIVLIVLDRPTSMSLTSQGTASYGDDFTIDITLTDAVNSTGINDNVIYFTADVQGYPISGDISGGSGGNYVATFNGSDFTTLGTFTITIVWTWPTNLAPYYQSQSGTTLIRIVNRASTLTYDPVGNVAYGDNATVNLRFEDTLNGTGIVNAVPFVNATPSTRNSLGNGNYLVSVNTRYFGGSLGTRYLKISLNWSATVAPFYKNQTVLVKVVVVNRPSQLIADAPDSVQYGQDLVFSVIFSDLTNGSRLAGAAVNVATTNVSSSVALQGDNSYRITIASTSFSGGPGVYYTVVGANWSMSVAPFYSNKTVLVKLTISERSTQVSYDSLSPTPYLNNFTFYINIQDGLNGTAISSATLVGNLSSAITWSLVSPGRYLVSINTTLVGTPGVSDSFVRITFTMPNSNPYYVDSQVVLRLTTTQRPTSLSYDSLAPTAYGEQVTFNMNFLDALTGSGVSAFTNVSSPTGGVTVSAIHLGAGVFSVTVQDTGLLTVGLHPVAFKFGWVPTQVPYYANQSLTITISITARPVQLSYTGLVPTAYGELFDFTLILQDGINGQFLSGRASAISSNASTETISGTVVAGSYSVQISTTETTVGSRYFSFTVAANATFDSTTITIRFTTVNRPVQLIPNPISAVQYGENFVIVVRYTDGVTGTGLVGMASSISLNRTYNAPTDDGNGYYTIVVPSTQFSALDTYQTRISVSASAGVPYYAAVQVVVALQVVNRQSSFTVDQVEPAQYGQNFTILVHYKDNLNSTGIVGTIATNNSHAYVSGTSGDYTIRLNSTWLSLGTHYIQITATYPGGSPPFYTSGSSIIPVVVTPRGSTLTADKLSNVQFGENITVVVQFQDSVTGLYINIPVNQITVDVIGQTGVTIWSSGTNGVYQFLIGTWSFAGIGSYSINVSTSWTGAPFYYNRSRIVPVSIAQRGDLFYAGVEVYQTQPFNTEFNVSLYYLDTNNGSVIPDSASVIKSLVARTPGSSGTIISAINLTSSPVMYYALQKKWVITFNSSLFGNPASGYRVTLQFNWNPASKPFYINQTIGFNISTTVAATQLIVLGSFVEQAGDNHTLDFYYINRISGQGVDLATVAVNGTTSPTALVVEGETIWNGTAWYNATGGYYQLHFNVTSLTGNIHPFLITFSRTNFDPVTYAFALVKTKLGSEIISVNSTSNRILGQNMSMVVRFQYQGSGDPITDGIMRISSGISSDYWINNTEYKWRSLGNGLYNVTMATGESTIRITAAGFYLIYLNMSAGIAESRVISLQFELKQVPTNISSVYLNGAKSVAANPSITTQITKSVNITAEFVRLFPSIANITDSDRVYIASSSLASERDLLLNNNLYSYILPMSALGIGTHFLFIIAQRANYQQSTKSITITVTQVATSLNLYLNQTMNLSIQVKWGQLINVSAYYNNTVDNVAITGAGTTVTLVGGSGTTTSWTLAVLGNNWYYVLDSRVLGQAASYTMTISASRANYTTSSKVFTIQVVEVPTNKLTTNGTTITATWSTMFTIYVRYFTYLGANITGATIVSNPNYNSSAAAYSSGYYQLTYNASTFGEPKIYNMVITMSKTNYTSQSLTFSIDVKAIPTFVPPIADIAVFWGDTVNVSAQYLDTLHGNVPISGADIDVGDKDGALLSVPSYAGGVYSIRFNSTLLGLEPTVYVISLVFSRLYYTTSIVTVTVNVQNVPTSMAIYDVLGHLNSSLNVYWGDNITFTANVKRTDKNIGVMDATVSTSPGASTIQNLGNGNYTIRFNSTQLGIPGVYAIVVTATHSNYMTVIASLTIQVKAPSTQLIITNATTGAPLSPVNLYWGQQLVFNVTMMDTVHGRLLTGWTALFGPGTVQPTSTTPVLIHPNKTVIYASLVPDFYALTITASKANYMTPSASLNVVVSTIPTNLTAYDMDNMVTTQFTATWGTLLEVNLRYRNTMNNTVIDPTTATFLTSHNSKLVGATVTFPETIRFTFNCSLFAAGVSTISFQASMLHHQVATTTITLTIEAVATQLTIFNANSTVKNSTFSATWGTVLTFDIRYNESGGIDLATQPGVIVATPMWTGLGISSIAGRLAVQYNTATRVPGIYSITIAAALANRTSQSTIVTLEIRAVGTTINSYYATNYTATQNFNVYWNELLYVDVLYRTTSGSNLTNLFRTNTTAIPLAYSLANSSVTGRVRLTFNSTSLVPNVYPVTVTCARANYTTASIAILINVLPRPTGLNTYYTNQTPNMSFTTYATYSVAIYVQYNDTRLLTSITNVLGTTITSSMPSVPLQVGLFLQLSFTIATKGLYTIIISGERSNHETAQQSITINVLPIPTMLTVYNGTEIAPALKATWGTSFTVSLEYNNTYVSARIPGATVSLGSLNMTGTYNPVSGKYEFTISTMAVGQSGIYSLTFTATRANYVTSVASVTLEILQVSMKLDSYNVNGPVNAQFSIEWNNILSFTVRYHLVSIPTIALQPFGNISTTFPGTITFGGAGENISISVNSSKFGGTGIFSVTFVAILANHTTESLLVTIQVVNLQTRLSLEMSSSEAPLTFTNITASRQYFVNFNNNFTLRLTYSTLAGLLVDGASVYVRFIEGGSTWYNYGSVNTTIVNSGSGQYLLTLNTTTQLGDYSQYSLVVTIFRQNFTLLSEPLYIYPLKLQTRLNVSDSILFSNTVLPGQKFTVNYTETFTIYCALYDMMGSAFISLTQYPSLTYSATLKGRTYAPFSILPNGTAIFQFNTSAIDVDVGTSNYITITGEAGFFYPSGSSINLEVKPVPTSIAVKNGTIPVVAGSTLQVYYTKNFSLNVTYTDTLNVRNITNLAGVSVSARIYGYTIGGIYIGDGKWRLEFDSLAIPATAGSTPQVTISATYVNYTTTTFSFNLAIREVPTSLSVQWLNASGEYETVSNSITVNWSAGVSMRVFYNNTLDNAKVGTFLNPATIQAIFGVNPTYTEPGSPTGFVYYELFIDSALLRGGNTHTIIVTGNMQNYTGSEFRFNLVVLEVPTKLWAFNDTTYFTEGDTVRVYFGDTLRLNVSYQTLIVPSQNVSSDDATIRAVVFGFPIVALNLNNGRWLIEIHTNLIPGLLAGSTPQVVISATYTNYSAAYFSFNMQVLDLPTELIVPTEFQSVTPYVWGQSFSLTVKYNDTHNNALINGTLLTNYPATSITFNGTDYMLLFNTTQIGAPGIYRITLTANKVNYAAASFTITVQILEVPTTMTVLFNGQAFLAIRLKQTVTIVVNYSRTADGAPVQNALVTVTYTNDRNGTVLNRTLTYAGGVYTTSIILGLDTFYAEPKFLIVQAFRANYTIGKAAPVLQIQPVEVLPFQNQTPDTPMQDLITNIEPGTSIRFDFQLFDNSTGLGIDFAALLSVNISSTDLNIRNEMMTYVGNGTWRYYIDIPQGYDADYVIEISVFTTTEVKRQFDVQNQYTFTLQTKTYEGSVIPEWVFYLILGALVVVVFYFVLYQIRFKYPPIVRKIHDLAGSVRRGKSAAKIQVQKVASREEGIYSEFAKLLNEYSFLQTHAKNMAAQAKKAKAKGYVAPEDKDTLTKDFELTVQDKIVDVKSVAPAIFPKEGPKKIVIGAPKAEYTEPEKLAAPVAVVKPAAPAVPGVTGVPGVPAIPKIPAMPGAPTLAKPPSLAAMPKPAAKALPAKPGAPAAEGEGQEGLYGELVKLEQKKYKAQRSLRDLKAKKEKGILSEEEYEQYRVKFEEALDKINEKIAEIRRKLVNF